MKIRYIVLFVSLLNYLQLHAQCPDPSSLGVSDVGPCSAILTWTSGGATNWQIQYDTANFILGAGTILETFTNPYTITNLFPNTSYEFYVRDSCGIEEVSNWVGPFSFSTINLFTEISSNFIGVHYGKAKWGDYDSDGDLDFAIAGDPDSYSSASQIYRNDGGDVFTSIEADLIGGHYSDLDWGDLDNDGDLDLLLDGTLYWNDGSDIFNRTYSGLWANDGSTALGDCDNDGDLDLLISGRMGDVGDAKSYIYRNDGNELFTELYIDLRAATEGDAIWIDINNDLRQDLIISGNDINGNKHTTCYINLGNYEFIELLIDDEQFARTITAGDYDNDGDLDLLLCRTSGKIFRNDGNMIFTDIGEKLGGEGTYYGANWADIDNDGDLDLLVQIWDHYKPNFKVFINSQNRFIEAQDEIIDICYGSIDAGDYDSDGDLDLLITGSDENHITHTKIYKNNTLLGNSAPSIPPNLNSTDGSKAILSWDKSFDNETNQTSLSYNLSVGSKKEVYDIMTPMSDILSGYRRLPEYGNTGLNNSWIVDNLPEGKYYWKVQCIDNIFASSAFSNIDSFSIIEPYELLDLSLVGGTNGCSSFGDFDNDDTLDLIITGRSESLKKAQLYENLGSDNFTYVLNEFTPVYDSYIAVGDYDNDNDLDIVISGRKYSATEITEIYRNDGNFSFININTDVLGIRSGSVDWGDYDNDGDLDLLITGRNSNSIESSYRISKIYENTGGDTFQDIEIELLGTENGMGKWGDFDNDGDLDIIIA
ncbi:FG-GAP-like repeat-containing protein, partial [Bacteroidota bacterium]